MPAKSFHRDCDFAPTFRVLQSLMGTLCMFQRLIRSQAGCTSIGTKLMRNGYQTCIKKQHILRSKFSTADICRNKNPAPGGAFFIHSTHAYAKSRARSPSSSLMRDGRPIWFRMCRKGFGLSSSTLTIFFTSHSPEAIRIAAATGGTPAV